VQYRLEQPFINGERSDIWYICWTEKRRSYRRTTRTADPDLAETIFAQFLAAQHAPPERPTVSRICDAYADDREAEGIRSPVTLRAHLKPVKEAFGRLEPETLTRPVIRATIQKWRKEGISDSTTNKRLRMLRSSLNWAVREGWIPYAPHIEAPAQAGSRERYLERWEFEALFDAAGSPHLRVFLALGVWTGLRCAAILDLRWQDVDQRAMMIHPRGGHTKKKRASVPINTSLAIALGESLAIADSEYLVSWNRKKIGSVQTAFEATVRRAGIEKVTIHDLRRTCATWMRQEGVSLAKIAAVLGDELRTVELHYAKHGPDYLKDATGSIG
jgi:integrase